MTRCTRTAQRATLRRTMLQHATRARTACAINTTEAPTRRRCKLHGWTHATCWRVSASHRVESSTIAQSTCRTRRIPGLAQLSVARCMHHAGAHEGHAARRTSHAASAYADKGVICSETATGVGVCAQVAESRAQVAHRPAQLQAERNVRCNGATCKMQRGWTQSRESVHTERVFARRSLRIARAGALSFAKAPRRFTVRVVRRALHGEPLRRLPAAFYMLQLRTAALPQPMRAVASAVPLTHSTDWPA